METTNQIVIGDVYIGNNKRTDKSNIRPIRTTV